MIEPLGVEALRTLVALTAAHFAADFLFQTNWMVANKRRASVFGLHMAIVGGLAVAALGWLAPPVLLLILISHAAMDAIKLWLMKPGLGAFVIDQAVHGLAIVTATLIMPDAFERGLWNALPDPLPRAAIFAMLASGALIAAVHASGIAIGMLLVGLKPDAAQEVAGLPEGGLYIGWLERALTLLLVAIGQPAGVGLLLTAKSILRFGDIKDSRDRARAEYIMIGTFLSIGVALAIGVVAREAALRL